MTRTKNRTEQWQQQKNVFAVAAIVLSGMRSHAFPVKA